MSGPAGALTRLAALGTLSRGAGEGLSKGGRVKPLSRTAGEGGLSPQGWVGEGNFPTSRAGRQDQLRFGRNPARRCSRKRCTAGSGSSSIALM
jgi:hypothetical protein